MEDRMQNIKENIERISHRLTALNDEKIDLQSEIDLEEILGHDVEDMEQSLRDLNHSIRELETQLAGWEAQTLDQLLAEAV